MDVLIINHKFPPDQGVATFRVAKFAKYLSDLGCNIFVLTRNNNSRKSNAHSDVLKSLEYIERLDMVSDKIISATDLRWLFPLIKRSLKLINARNIDIVFHSGPQFLPFTNCIPVKKYTGVPYIIDLRDPWLLDDQPTTGGLRNWTYSNMNKFFQPRVFESASAIVLNNNQMKSMYSKQYPSLSEKMLTINNGYDPEDYEDIEPTQIDKFRIVFPGKFRDYMRWFFEPFSKFVDGRPDVSFTHFGKKDRENTAQVRSVVEELGLEKYVSFEGYVPRKQVFAALLGADLGLAVGRPGDETHVPTKIYDYMGCDIPIMSVDDGVSAMRDILSRFPNAYMRERSNREAVYDTLIYAYENRPSCLGNPNEMEKYMRYNLTRELQKLMRSLVETETTVQRHF